MGNLTNTGVAVSEHFFKRAGLRYSSSQSGGVSTASQDYKLLQLGVTKVFTLQFVGNDYRFVTKAVVLRGLKEEVNIGSAFFQRVGSHGVPIALRFDAWGTQLSISVHLMDLIHKLPEEVGGRCAAKEGFDYWGIGSEYLSSLPSDENDSWEGEGDSAD